MSGNSDSRNSGTGLQFWLLFKKNLIVKKRQWGSTLWEFLVPVIGCLIIVLIRSVVKISSEPAKLNLKSSLPLLPNTGGTIQSFLHLAGQVACGDSGERRKRGGAAVTAPVTFAVVGSKALEKEKLALAKHVRDEFLSIATIYPEHNCSTAPVMCGHPLNKEEPECVNAKKVVVSLKSRVNRSKFIQLFDSKEKLFEYIEGPSYATSNDENPPIYMAVHLISGAPNWNYTIYGNWTIMPSMRDVVRQWTVGFNKDNWAKYVDIGFTMVQYIVDNWIIKTASKGKIKLGFFGMEFVPFPLAPYKRDWFDVSGLIGLYFIMCFMWPFSRLVKCIVEEKEKRIKEGMRMMGLRSAAFWFSWMATYCIVFTIIALLTAIFFDPAVFKHTEFGVIFLVYWLFGLSLVTLACFVSSMFSRSKTAGILSGFVLFGLWMPSGSLGEKSNGTIMLACISSPVAFTLALQRISKYELSFVGVSSNNLYEVIEEYSVGQTINMLLVDIFLYGFLSWYLDKVVHSDYGTHLPPWFCCMPRYWCPSKFLVEEEEDPEGQNLEANNNVQPVSDELKDKAKIKIQNLTKIFGPGPLSCKKESHTAVDHLNLNMYEGQLFVLLGHNGAGKTTTINMLTGMMPVSSGNALMYDRSVTKELQIIRKFLGVCPQHDILFDKLSVKEHLEMFGRMKGVSKEVLAEEVDKAIKEIGLEEKPNQLAEALSGGQKRRLSLAIALIGGSKVLFLDEPTSGVDPASRRAIWDLLSSKKSGRVIILTTHFMDEADILGDRIAILHKGKIRCCGTPMFLKKIYGVGYNIVMTKVTSDIDSNSLTSIVSKHVPSATELTNSGTEVTMRLPFTASQQFPSLLKELETEGKEAGCSNFGLSVTTMEEVFLRVALEKNNSKKDSFVNKPNNVERIDTAQLNILNASEDQSGFDVLCNHFKAMMMKRWAIVKRDRKAQCCQFLLPILLLIIGLEAISAFPQPKAKILPLSPSMFPSPTPVPYNFYSNKWYTEGNVTIDERFIDAYPFRDSKNNLMDISNTTVFSQKLLDTHTEGLGKFGAYFFSKTKIKNWTTTKVSMYSNYSGVHTLPTFLTTLNSGIYRRSIDSKSSINCNAGRMPLTQSEVINLFGTLGAELTAIMVTLSFCFVPAAYIVFVVKEREIKSKHIQIVSGVRIEAYWCSNFIFDLICFSIPGLIGAFIIYGHGQEAFTGDNFSILILNIFLYGFAVIPFTYLFSFLFHSSNTAQNVMFMVYMIGGVVCLIVYVVLFMIPSTKDDANVARFFFRLLPPYCLGDAMFHMSILPWMNRFIMSSKEATPYDMDNCGWDMLFMGIESVVYFIIVIVLDNLVLANKLSLNCRECFKLPPPKPIFVLSSKATLNLGDKRATAAELSQAQKQAFSAKFGGAIFVNALNRRKVVSVQGTCQLLETTLDRLSLVWENCKKADNVIESGGVHCARVMEADLRALNEDADVIQERERIQGGSDDLVTLNGLRKVYPPSKVAVNDLWYGVSAGQCFGFLGLNGAGKTTTLKMVTGDVIPTQGDAFIDKISAIKEPWKVRRMIGYCPQFDALHPLMTAVETLNMYATIRGVPFQNIPKMVDYLIKRLTLDQDNQHKRRAGTYSGGNKRKLSVAIALIGSPKCVFLDEPSTGMDPVSRRFMWNFISETMASRAVILTTHSMEECEALCSKIGILVGGQLRCIGTSQHLKAVYGSGFQFSLTVQDVHVEKVQEWVFNTFDSVTELECYGGNLKYKMSQQSKSLSEIFSVIESCKEEYGILDYCISQTTLEQIFIQFAKQDDWSADNANQSKDSVRTSGPEGKATEEKKDEINIHNDP